ncbi:MAG: signal peptidase I [Candidatus Aenigmarchaeota archaeon]|nr:signal peptidase I [Candidatus Aenigmarchaeota archaeon]OYT56825.1 MAG: signal peptidase I [Candidatus Aenigmarchaeota archaeon ex4484_14]RLI97047.1 MAG: signal peptidase I [Candidatus Aenigmarchaeota archaeon]
MTTIKDDVKEIAIAIVVAIIFYYTLGLLLHTDLPIVSVYSDSMLPILHRGDLLLCSNWGEKNKGDVIIYINPKIGYPIVHRIVSVEENGFITKGDHNARTDQEGFGISPVTENQIKGKVLFGVPLLGYPRLFIDSPARFIRCDILGVFFSTCGSLRV